MTPEARKLITRALAALGPAPSDAEMELVTETLHAASDQGVEDAFTAAAAAIWSDGDEQPLEEIYEIARETEAHAFTAADLVRAMALGIIGPMRTASGWR